MIRQRRALRSRKRATTGGCPYGVGAKWQTAPRFCNSATACRARPREASAQTLVDAPIGKHVIRMESPLLFHLVPPAVPPVGGGRAVFSRPPVGEQPFTLKPPQRANTIPSAGHLLLATRIRALSGSILQTCYQAVNQRCGPGIGRLGVINPYRCPGTAGRRKLPTLITISSCTACHPERSAAE